MMPRRKSKPRAPLVPLAAREYFLFDTAGPDLVEAWKKYHNFCKKRGGDPPSTPEQFQNEWVKKRAEYAERRAKLGIALPARKQARQ